MKRMLPEPVTGYVLEPRKGYISIVAPEYSENLNINPSFEYSLSGYTYSGSVSRTISYQSRGGWSVEITGTNANNFNYVISLSANSKYTWSLDLRGQSGYDYALEVYDPSSNRCAYKKVTGSDSWKRVYVIFGTSALGNYTMRLRTLSTKSHTFHTDGWQIENKPYPTTYIDGDLRGFLANRKDFLWLGSPHNSKSVRISDCRAGGREYFLNDLGVHVTGIVGLTGIGPVKNIANELSFGGAYYYSSIYTPRTFTIVGAIFGESASDIIATRNALISILKPSVTNVRQKMLLRYQTRDECGDPSGDAYNIPCLYNSGLEGNLDNLYEEKLTITFDQFDSYIYKDFETATELKYDVLSESYSGMVIINENGYMNIVASCPHDTKCLAHDDYNGNLMVGGNSVGIAGLDSRLAMRPDATGVWQLMAGAQPDGVVNEIASTPEETIVAGNFNNLGGGKVAVYNVRTNSWYGIGTPNGEVKYMCCDPLARVVYIAGDFTSISGQAFNGFAAFDFKTSTWINSSTNMVGGAVTGIGYKYGHAYVTGDFTSVNSVPDTKYCAKFSNSGAWLGIEGSDDFLTAPFGSRLLVNPKSTIFGISGGHLVVWKKGSGWYDTGVTAMHQYDIDGDGWVYLHDSDMVSNKPGIKMFREQTLKYYDIAFFSWDQNFAPIDMWISRGEYEKSYMLAISVFEYPFYIRRGYNDVFVNSEHDTYPVIEIRGPLIVAGIKNYTTRRMFSTSDQLPVAAGETVIINTREGSLSITSSVDIRQPKSSVIKDTAETNFYLAPGHNHIDVFAYDNQGGIFSDKYQQLSTGNVIFGTDLTNTDNGILYMTVNNTTKQVYFYKNSARTQLVAHTEVYTGPGQDELEILPDNSSGIRGVITVLKIVQDDSSVYMQCGLIFMHWREEFINVEK